MMGNIISPRTKIKISNENIGCSPRTGFQRKMHPSLRHDFYPGKMRVLPG